MIRRGRVLALARLYLSRTPRTLMAVLVAMLLMAMLNVIKRGLNTDSVLPWVIGGCAVLPLICPIGIIREKAEGSLRFVAFLPVTPAEHAGSRLLVVALLTLPAAVVTFAAFLLRVPGASVGLALAAGGGAGVALATMSLVLTALQLRTPLGQGLVYVIYALLGLLVLAKALSALASTGWLRGGHAFLTTPTGWAVLSLLAWGACAMLGWWASRQIARTTSTYRGERAAS